MTRISANNAKEEINGAIARVISDGEEILIYGENGAVAALIPIEEYELLRRIEEEEEKLDVAEAERRLSDPAQTPVPYETVRQELGLNRAD